MRFESSWVCLQVCIEICSRLFKDLDSICLSLVKASYFKICLHLGLKFWILIWVLMSKWILRKKFEIFYLFVSNALYWNWMFNICPLSNIMSWLMTSDFFWGKICQMACVFSNGEFFVFFLGCEVAKIRPKKFKFLFKLLNVTLCFDWL